MSFASDVRVHEHSMELTDNPAVSGGLPVGLKWNVRRSFRYDLEAHEEEKDGQKRKPKKLSQAEREGIVKRRHTRSSIVRVQKEVRGIKQSRREIEQAENPVQRSHAYKAPFFVRWLRGRQAQKQQKA